MGIETLWEPLREISGWAATFDWATKFIVFGLSIVVLVISLLAWRRTKSRRFLLIAGAFFFFAVKWGLKIADMFFSPGAFLPDSSENVFELAILALLIVAIFKK